MSPADELRELHRRYEHGWLTADEYELAKRRVLTEGAPQSVPRPAVVPWFFWTSLVLALGLAAAFMGIVGSRDNWWLPLPLGLYLLAVLWLGRAVLLTLFRRPRALYFTRRLAVPGWLIVLLAVSALGTLTLFREGFFPSLFRWDVSLTHSSRSRQSQASSNFSASHGGQRTPLRELPIVCTQLPDGRRSHLAEGFNNALNPPAPPNSPWRVDIQIALHAPDSWACTPLVKWGSVAYQATVKLSWRSPTAQGSGTITVNGTVRQTVWGICSTRQFNYWLGREIEADVVGHINQFLARN
jgi:hypothetical protein